MIFQVSTSSWDNVRGAFSMSRSGSSALSIHAWMVVANHGVVAGEDTEPRA